MQRQKMADIRTTDCSLKSNNFGSWEIAAMEALRAIQN